MEIYPIFVITAGYNVLYYNVHRRILTINVGVNIFMHLFAEIILRIIDVIGERTAALVRMTSRLILSASVAT